jgi:hypothetical protein
MVLGIIIAVGLGVIAYQAEGVGLLTCLLPLAILLLSLADFMDYWGSAANESADPRSKPGG